jgi:hypothetical protein
MRKTNSMTPGPWKTIDTYVESSSGRLIANAIKLKGKSLLHDQELHDEAVANARLIAAAPELLAALKSFVACRASNGDGTFSKCAPNDSDIDTALALLTRIEVAGDGR